MYVDEFYNRYDIDKDLKEKYNPNFLFLIMKYYESSRYVFLRGGTRSGKTYSTLLFVIYYCYLNRNKRITITSRDYNMLRRNIYTDFLNILDYYNIKYNLNKTYMTFTINTNIVSLQAFDDEMKARGSQRDLLVLDEANSISYEIYNQLSIRTSQMIIFTYNPSSYFYIQDLFDNNFIYENELITTYKHNVHLSESQKSEIENIKDDYLRDVYVYGEFSNNTIKLVECTYITKEEFDNYETDYVIAGLDFSEGSSVHAMCIVKKNKNSNDVYVYNNIYVNSDLETLYKLILNDVIKYKVQIILADSAQQDFIKYLKSKKLSITNCNKYTLQYSYLKLKNYNIKVVKNTYLEKEIKKLDYDVKTFKIKSDDHAIDAMRYAIHFFF